MISLCSISNTPSGKPSRLPSSPTDPSTQPSSEPSNTNQLQLCHQIHLRIHFLTDEFDHTTTSIRSEIELFKQYNSYSISATRTSNISTARAHSNHYNSALAHHDKSSGENGRVHGSNQRRGHELNHSEHNASSCSQFKCMTRCK